MMLWPDFALARAALSTPAERRSVRADEARERRRFETDRMEDLLTRRQPSQPLSSLLIWD
jgi:hypothetical protein